MAEAGDNRQGQQADDDYRQLGNRLHELGGFVMELIAAGRGVQTLFMVVDLSDWKALHELGKARLDRVARLNIERGPEWCVASLVALAVLARMGKDTAAAQVAVLGRAKDYARLQDDGDDGEPV